MRKNLLLAAATFSMALHANPLNVVVTNPTSLERDNETIEVSVEEINKFMGGIDQGRLVVTDKSGRPIPSQITYDGNLIFQTSLDPKAKAVYTIEEGDRENYPSSVFGKVYKQRLDDFGWENDYVIFRLYGPALQATGERSFGFDAWVKNSRDLELENFYNSGNYHEDHGKGLDCYGVGPNLGCGAPALMHDGQIIYPWSYEDIEILENGPLRMTAKLRYGKTEIGDNKDVVETRLLSIDKGTRMTRLTTRFDNLTHPEKVVAGLVMHPGNVMDYFADPKLGVAGYRDPAGDNGDIYVGLVFTPSPTTDARAIRVTDEESRKLRGGAVGHVAAVADYQPGDEFTYYFGNAWSKDGMTDLRQWEDYLTAFSHRLQTPLKVTLKKGK